MAAQIDQLQIRSGSRVTLPVLLDAELGYAEDENRLYVGTASGKNMPQPNMSDLGIHSAGINGAVNVANNAYNNNATILETVTSNQSSIDGYNAQSIEILNNYYTLKPMQIFIATVASTTVIPIPQAIYSIVDLTQVVLDVYYKKNGGSNVLLDLNTDYTIDSTNNKINLVSISMAVGETIKYRVYR